MKTIRALVAYGPVEDFSAKYTRAGVNGKCGYSKIKLSSTGLKEMGGGGGLFMKLEVFQKLKKWLVIV